MDALCAEIKGKLEALTDPKTGESVVREAFVTRQLHSGPYADMAPEILVGYQRGFRHSWDCATGSVAAEVFSDNTKSWSGDHCVDPRLVPGRVPGATARSTPRSRTSWTWRRRRSTSSACNVPQVHARQEPVRSRAGTSGRGRPRSRARARRNERGQAVMLPRWTVYPALGGHREPRSWSAMPERVESDPYAGYGPADDAAATATSGAPAEPERRGRRSTRRSARRPRHRRDGPGASWRRWSSSIPTACGTSAG